MKRALIVEDTGSDMRRAAKLLTELGLDTIEGVTRVDAAMNYLQAVLEGKKAAPDLIILDLLFTYESGFELLRLWKSNPQLQSIPIVVWTDAGEVQQELCKHFGVELAHKSEGVDGLRAKIKASAAHSGA